MFTLKISVHSMVDVITNSSTVIYVQCTDQTIKNAKELIDLIIKSSGGIGCADDYYDFEIRPEKESAVDNISENLGGYKESIRSIKEYENIDLTKIDWKKETEIAEKLFHLMVKGTIEKPDSLKENCNGWNTETLIIKAKKGDLSIDLNSKVQSIFSIDGERDG